MQINPILRWANRVALITPISVVATTSLAFAEFRIEEAGIEKGEVEMEYRGAYHWGVPAATADNENANDLIQKSRN